MFTYPFSSSLNSNEEGRAKMAIFRLEVKSHGKGKAERHSRYINRIGAKAAKDLVARGHGNLPSFANDEPSAFWVAADSFERVNGAAAREYIVSLPKELSDEQNTSLTREIAQLLAPNLPYEFALHRPRGAISGEDHPHAHISTSDRALDGIERPPEQYFSRAHPTRPEAGGARKISGGKPPGQLSAELQRKKMMVAGLINAALTRNGLHEQVDHRSNEERGIKKVPERRLHPAAVRQLGVEELALIRQRRRQM
ncbi:MobA/MobL family protein [Variovorax sp. Varisp62]|uniref:MobA/MobL family protein n=1 Tax=Variovorax sp. Varisp62 TaxID=3243049 RepID=UPI0039B540E3